MSFAGISQFMGGGQPSPTDDNGPNTPVHTQQMGLDSITLGQLRAMGPPPAQKPKACDASTASLAR
jgi:hypothetical protein